MSASRTIMLLAPETHEAAQQTGAAPYAAALSRFNQIFSSGVSNL